MVPPPGSTGDEFPDFDSMTLEEQMAWLESLARRQGVNDEELTTDANLDIPIPENAVVDEPGYVPFEGSASARRMKEAQEAADSQPEALAEEPPSEREKAMPMLDEEAEAAIQAAMAEMEEPGELPEFDLDAVMAGDSADPMRWLDSLTAQPEGSPGDLDLFADSAELGLPEEFGELEDMFAEISEADALDFLAEAPDEAMADEPPFMPEAAEAAAEGIEPGAAQAAETGAASLVSEDDPLGGVDPMLWLESLAARQGVRREELTTTADLEVADVPEDAVVDEPGYVPFEGSASARRMKEAQAAAESMPEAVSEPEPEIPQELADLFDMQGEAAVAEEGELLGGADPMTWLESLALRQGAKKEELTTTADLEIPELPPDTIIDEPGYVEYSPFGILSPDQDIDLPEGAPEAAEPEWAAPEAEPDASLSWLEDLAAEPDVDLSGLLAFGEEAVETDVREGAAAVEDARPLSDDLLADMTDEDVAYAQARGELTPQQELAWLKRQAARLAAVRDSQDMEMMSVEEEEVAPAQPGELPPWLAQMREESEQARPPEPSPLTEGIGLPEGVIDLASLLDEAAAGVGFDLSEVEIDTDEQLIEAVEELWAEQPSQADLELLGEFVPESELAAFLESGLMPDEHDPLAEALDAEFERRLTGDETEPEWYTDAVARVAAEAPAVPEMEAELPGEAPAEPVVAEAMPVEMPDWLKEAEEELQEPMASDSAVPDWLQEPSEAEPAIPTELPEWLVERAEELEPAMEGDVPDWLLEIGSEEPEVSAVDWLPAEAQEPEVAQTVAEPTPPPAPEPVAPAPPPVTRAVPPAAPVAPAPVKAAPTVPPGEFFETYRQRLEADPDDHPSRLGLARALRASQEWVSSLDHYEALIETSQLLQDVSGDLISVVEQQPKTPRARRLLGDAYMRQGMLQEALDAYRSALNQL